MNTRTESGTCVEDLPNPVLGGPCPGTGCPQQQVS